MKSQARKVPKGHQGPGHEVPAGVGRSSAGVRGSVQGCPVEGPLAGVFSTLFFLPAGMIQVSFWEPLGIVFH